jgi:hypothetical protein
MKFTVRNVHYAIKDLSVRNITIVDPDGDAQVWITFHGGQGGLEFTSENREAMKECLDAVQYWIREFT